MPKRAQKQTDKKKLTKRNVDALKPDAAEYFVWDSETTGFGLRVFPSGAKTYFVQYRSGGGRTRRFALGRHGHLTADQARAEAKRRLGEVACGQDPSEARATLLAAPTVEVLAKRFLTDHVTIHCKPSTERNYAQQVRAHILPRIGKHKVSDIQRSDIANLHHSLRHIPHQANRVLATLSKMFNLAELWGWRRDGSNPCRMIPKFKEHPKERYLNQNELACLSDVLAHIEREATETPFVIAAFRLLILTGCRLGEIQKLRWDEVKGDTLHLADSKTGARRIPLSSEAQAVLAALTRTPGHPFVIEGKHNNAHVTDLQRPWRRIRAEAGLDDVRIHDLRHTFASIAVQNGVDLLTVGRLLGHSSYQTTERYVHLADEPIRRAGQHVAGLVTQMMQPSRPPAPSHLRIVT